MAAESRMTMIVDAKNEASGKLRTIKGDIQSLSKQAEIATGGMSAFGKALGVVGLLALGRQAAQVTAELVNLGAQTGALRVEFEGLASRAGASASEMLSEMQRVSRGTISEFNLMKSANQAMILGVADSADEMAALMEFAQTRARQLSISTQFAFESLVTGIGRSSALILDNVGISTVQVQQAMDDYAASIGTTADKLDDAGKKAALLNAVIAANRDNLAGTQGASRTAVESINALGTAWEDLKAQLGESIVPIVQPVLDGLVESIRATIEEMRRQAASAALRTQLAGTPADALLAGIDDPGQQESILRGIIDRTRAQAQAQVDEYQRMAQNAKGQIDAIFANTPGLSREGAASIYQSQLETVIADAAEMTRQTEIMQAALDSLTGSTTASVEAITQAGTNAVATTAGVTEEMAAAIAAVQQRAAGGLAAIANKLAEVQGDDAAIGWLRNTTEHLAVMVQRWTEAGYTIDEINAVILPRYLSNVDGIVSKTIEAYNAMAGMGKGAQQAEATAASALRNIAARIDVVTTRAVVAAGAIARLGAASDGIAGRQNALLAAVRGEGTAQGTKRTDELADATGRLSARMQTFLDIGTAGGSGGGGVAGLADDFGDLRSRIEQVISSATTLDFGISAEDLGLPREDAINENARRLGAIMREGIGNQSWLEEFKTEVPGIFEEIANSGDPRAAAARILREFQGGLRPELLDRTAIKERVKAMILGDQNTAALAQEIAAELSGELGVSMAQAQQAVGSLLGTGAGGALQGAAAGGIDGGAQAEMFTNGFVAMMNTMLSRFYDTGATAGSQWGSGFLTTVEGGVPAALIGILAALVTPAVMASLAAQGTRTGAQ